MHFGEKTIFDLKKELIIFIYILSRKKCYNTGCLISRMQTVDI